MRRELEPLPAGVQLGAEPEPDVTMVVLSFEIADRLPGLFDKLPHLRVIQALSAGVDWLLPKVPAGVVVCRAVGVHDGPVSQWVVAGSPALQRRLPEFVEYQRRGEWNRSTAEPPEIDDLDGHTVLIVGHRSPGRAVGRRPGP